jgi:hypothetical protein
MAIQMDDGTLLIHAVLDGPFEPVVKVKSISQPSLAQHVLEHGRPTTQKDSVRKETIKRLIREMQTRLPSLTFVQAWNRLQQTRPELFD